MRAFARGSPHARRPPHYRGSAEVPRPDRARARALDASIATLRTGIFEAEGLEDRLLQAEMLRELGQTSKALGNSADARLAWTEAAETFDGVGARHEADEITALLATSWRERRPEKRSPTLPLRGSADRLNAGKRVT